LIGLHLNTIVLLGDSFEWSAEQSAAMVFFWVANVFYDGSGQMKVICGV